MRSEDFRPRTASTWRARSPRNSSRDGSRIGSAWSFAGQSELASPLTLDYDGLTALIDGLDFGQLPDGTAIGAGIAQAAQRLRAAKGRSKVMILLTDGINNAGAVDPVTAARLARAVGVRIYAIGAGTQGAAPFPVDDPLLGRRYVWVRSEVDEPTLREVASATGGRFFRATSAGF
jgi:Ca-activated chloride channel family protein